MCTRFVTSGLPDHHAQSLYSRVVDPGSWTPYPDTVEVLRSLREHKVKTAVVSNIAFDIRPAFQTAGAHADEFVLSFEVGAVKPDPRIFEVALDRLGVAAEDAIMIGDSEENDGAARALGCDFVLVDPLPVDERPTGLVDALSGRGITADRTRQRVQGIQQPIQLPALPLHPADPVLNRLHPAGLAGSVPHRQPSRVLGNSRLEFGPPLGEDAPEVLRLSAVSRRGAQMM